MSAHHPEARFQSPSELVAHLANEAARLNTPGYRFSHRDPQSLNEMHAAREAARKRMEDAGKRHQIRSDIEKRQASQINALQGSLREASLRIRELERALLVATANPAEANGILVLESRTESLLRIVSDVSGYTKAAIKSGRKEGPLVKARHIACWLAREFTRDTLPTIGYRIGGRDHTTILHAVRRVGGVIERLSLKDRADTPEQWAELLWSASWSGPQPSSQRREA